MAANPLWAMPRYGNEAWNGTSLRVTPWETPLVSFPSSAPASTFSSMSVTLSASLRPPVLVGDRDQHLVDQRVAEPLDLLPRAEPAAACDVEVAALGCSPDADRRRLAGEPARGDLECDGLDVEARDRVRRGSLRAD